MIHVIYSPALGFSSHVLRMHCSDHDVMVQEMIPDSDLVAMSGQEITDRVTASLDLIKVKMEKMGCDCKKVTRFPIRL
jgi:hypothetical protein